MQLLTDVMTIIQGLNLDGIVKSPSLVTGKNSIAVRTTATAPTEYMAGFTYPVGIQVLTQFADKNEPISLNACYAIVDALNGKQGVLPTNKYKCISARCTTLPRYVETDSQGRHVYTALFTFEIEIL